jgi:hypothetical protein
MDITMLEGGAVMGGMVKASLWVMAEGAIATGFGGGNRVLGILGCSSGLCGGTGVVVVVVCG